MSKQMELVTLRGAYAILMGAGFNLFVDAYGCGVELRRLYDQAPLTIEIYFVNDKYELHQFIGGHQATYLGRGYNRTVDEVQEAAKPDVTQEPSVEEDRKHVSYTRMLDVLREVAAERHRQNQKWGEQNHNPIEWIGILTEEVGEAAKEAVDAHFGYSPEPIACLERYRMELIQVAAVAVQAIECLDRETHGGILVSRKKLP